MSHDYTRTQGALEIGVTVRDCEPIECVETQVRCTTYHPIDPWRRAYSLSSVSLNGQSRFDWVELSYDHLVLATDLARRAVRDSVGIGQHRSATLYACLTFSVCEGVVIDTGLNAQTVDLLRRADINAVVFQVRDRLFVDPAQSLNNADSPRQTVTPYNPSHVAQVELRVRSRVHDLSTLQQATSPHYVPTFSRVREEDAGFVAQVGIRFAWHSRISDPGHSWPDCIARQLHLIASQVTSISDAEIVVVVSTDSHQWQLNEQLCVDMTGWPNARIAILYRVGRLIISDQ